MRRVEGCSGRCQGRGQVSCPVTGRNGATHTRPGISRHGQVAVARTAAQEPEEPRGQPVDEHYSEMWSIAPPSPVRYRYQAASQPGLAGDGGDLVAQARDYSMRATRCHPVGHPGTASDKQAGPPRATRRSGLAWPGHSHSGADQQATGSQPGQLLAASEHARPLGTSERVRRGWRGAVPSGPWLDKSDEQLGERTRSDAT
ncbi:hypothetical protein GGS23DRAFT_445727 [Durotheca rogersii]|uniref:uncharacterized protein n=1 Tax=Durotheca rogersii TaxID=419775 RepID=UPI00221E5765|nr:uncharacterized protein GGS23DRAFT_445727 [Durotheca rogersii]KAI5855060.1 hypothetical protein GGS23DRAFT_445727 [Durotheca rogersii]